MRWLIAIAVLVAVAAPARAHQSSVKIVDLAIDGSHVAVAFTVVPTDVTDALGLPADAKPTAAEAAVPATAAYVADWLQIAGCTRSTPAARADGAFVIVEWQCAMSARVDELELDFSTFFDLDTRHEAAVSAHAPGARTDPTIVRAGDPVVVVRAGEGASISAWILYGMDHIYSGYDHICFVLALLVAVVLVRAQELAVRPLGSAIRATATVITAFTIAHSLSLIGASLGWISLPSRLVESLIAASILYTAVENVVRPDPRWRFALTFAFGLVHGLGFASTLEERLPPTNVIVPLLGFNVGVEIGQLTVVAVALPVAWFAARSLGARRYRTFVLPGFAVVVGAVAIKWLIERAFAL